MKKIGLFYNTEATKTAEAGKKIREALVDIPVDVISIENAGLKDFEVYDFLILGVSTWFDGELPTSWDELLPGLKTLNLKNKKIAIFGLGDQVNYPDNFADAIGILADTFEACGATVTGSTPTAGYEFNQSLAVRDERFMGLVLDFENQAGLTDQRIRGWVEELKIAFNDLQPES